MSHMQREITHKQDGWAVETTSGTSYVPSEVVAIPRWLAMDTVISETAETSFEVSVFDMLASHLRDYIEGTHIHSVEAITLHYFARLSAPGYLDCTEWCAFKTVKEARDYLREI